MIWSVLGFSALAVAGLLGVTIVVAARVGKVAVVDVTWGLLFVAVGWVSWWAGAHGSRGLLLAVLVTLWGGRLAWHLARRSRGHGEDPRYVRLLQDAPPGRTLWYAVPRVFVVQGLLAWFVALPVQVTALDRGQIGWLGWLGTAVVLGGLLLESVADAQLAAFKADPRHRGQVMQHGVWSWSRHPNYFGDAVVWWGVWLVSAEAWPGGLTVLSPVLMTYLLVRVSGVALLERSMSGRPGWAEYAARTSSFVPRPPRRGRAGQR